MSEPNIYVENGEVVNVEEIDYEKEFYVALQENKRISEQRDGLLNTIDEMTQQLSNAEEVIKAGLGLTTTWNTKTKRYDISGIKVELMLEDYKAISAAAAERDCE